MHPIIVCRRQLPAKAIHNHREPRFFRQEGKITDGNDSIL
jgi:hypothetical protein